MALVGCVAPMVSIELAASAGGLVYLNNDADAVRSLAFIQWHPAPPAAAGGGHAHVRRAREPADGGDALGVPRPRVHPLLRDEALVLLVAARVRRRGRATARVVEEPAREEMPAAAGARACDPAVLSRLRDLARQAIDQGVRLLSPPPSDDHEPWAQWVSRCDALLALFQALWWAAAEGRDDVVRLLLDGGASAETPDRYAFVEFYVCPLVDDEDEAFVTTQGHGSCATAAARYRRVPPRRRLARSR